jgi:hypothetical protein
LLIVLVQRVCKYPLLLREMIKTTPEDKYPAEFQQLTDAFSRIDDVLTYINEKKRDTEMAYKVKQIAKQMSGVPDVS